jgi:DNA-binding NtrC family response regulator
MFAEKPILIVEDEAFVALDLSMAVEEFHGQVIGPVATVTEALALLKTETIAAAILDANLADRDVTPVALRLAERGVPFVIHTGSGIPAELAAIHPNLTMIVKPVPSAIVIVCLLNEMRDPRNRDLLR